MNRIGWAAALLLAIASPLSGQQAPTEPVEAQPSSIDLPTRLADLGISVEQQPPALIPTEDFAARSTLRAFRMSPDGVHLAVSRIVDGSITLNVIDVETRQAIKSYALASNQRLDWIRWAGNNKLIFSVSQMGAVYDVPVRINRLFVRNITNDVGYMIDVGARVWWGGDIIHLAEDGSYALISVQRSWRSPPSVYRYALEPDAERELVVRPKRGVWEWVADNAGVVRLGLGRQRNVLRIYYRNNADEDFELIDRLRRDDERSRYWRAVRIISGSDQGYILEEGDNGRVGVRLFDYSTGQPVETFYENPDWDVEELWLRPDGSPLAALYTDDRDRIEWFDDEMRLLDSRLRSALDLEDLTIITRSRQGERMLVWAGSEADPGALYTFSREGRELAFLENYRPELDFRLLARPLPIRYRARDGLMISGYLTLPRGRDPSGLPLIIMPHGGPYGIRDKLEYNDEVQLLANRGYAVLQPNYRGSGGYGEAFSEAGTGEIGRAMQDDIDDAMDWAVAEGLADADRVCVVGASYGGYAALWAVLRNPDRYRCAASWAGVTDWDRMLRYDRRYLSRKGMRAWRERVEGEDEFDLDTVSPTEFAEQLSRPVLLAHGTSDSNVPVSQYHAFRRAVGSSNALLETLLIEGEGHSFSKAENEQAWYDALEAFLARHNPADPADAMDGAVPSSASANDEQLGASPLSDLVQGGAEE